MCYQMNTSLLRDTIHECNKQTFHAFLSQMFGYSYKQSEVFTPSATDFSTCTCILLYMQMYVLGYYSIQTCTMRILCICILPVQKSDDGMLTCMQVILYHKWEGLNVVTKKGEENGHYSHHWQKNPHLSNAYSDLQEGEDIHSREQKNGTNYTDKSYSQDESQPGLRGFCDKCVFAQPFQTFVKSGKFLA